MKVSFRVNDRSIDFTLDLDPQHVASMKTYAAAALTDQMCEPELIHVFTRMVRPGDFVIDGGANVGFFTAVLSQLVGPTGRVLAVEPGSNNLPLLRRNMELNKMDNVEIVTAPLWHVAEKVTLHMSSDSGLNALCRHEFGLGRADMMATTIDALCDGDIPRLIKLDIEGAETRALRGGMSTLDHRQTVLICELNDGMQARFGDSQMGLRKQAAMCGLDTFIIHQDGSLPRMVPWQTRLLMSVQNRNIMFTTLDDVGLAWPEQDLG